MTKAERQEHIDAIRAQAKRGDILVTVDRGTRNFSGSRPVDFYIGRRNKRGDLILRAYVTFRVAKLMGYRVNERRGVAILPFMNMDAGFATAAALSGTLWKGATVAQHGTAANRRGLRSEWL